jgi:phage baseplate assembly protein V
MSEETDLAFDQSELGRRLDQVVCLGRVSAIDAAANAARVALDEDGEDGGIVTDFLPWLEPRHGDTRSRFLPSVGERVIVLAPSGELGAGVILGGLPCTDTPPAFSGNRQGFEFSDGTIWSHDAASKVTELVLPSGGTLTLKVGGTSIKISDGVVEIDAASIKLGSGGALREVARKGDAVSGGLISSGSSAVKAV